MPTMRAQASAIYIGVITIVASIGPVLVSQMTKGILVPNRCSFDTLSYGI